MNPRPYAFSPTAACPEFTRFLEDVLPDHAVRSLVQEMTGLLQVHDTSFEKFFMLVGEGANGKSTLLRIVRAVTGERNVSSVPLRSLSDKFRLITVTQALANVVSESAEEFGRHKLVEDTLKAVVSGEVITVEEKFKGAYTAPATARIVVAANDLPLISDRTEGTWRRAIVVPFDVTIPEEKRDGHLATRIISNETPGVFNWALEGYLRLRERGRFDVPEICREALGEHRIKCAPEKQFFEHHVQTGSNSDFVPTADLYAAYQTFVRANGYRGEMNVTSFSAAIGRASSGAEKTMRRVDGVRTRGYAGLTFSADGFDGTGDSNA